MQYNSDQLNAINAEEDKVIITAPPGSGKTTSIVGAIEKYVEENPADRVVAVTFTRKGAEDLQRRINNDTVEVSTIHSWSYKVLQYFAGKYNFTIALLQEDRIKEILKLICAKFKQRFLNQFLLYSYVMGNYNIDVDDNILKTFEKIRESYIDFKRRMGLYDFTDLPLYLSDIMDEYGEEIDFVDALFVDEFQDVDDIQINIFNRVNARKKVYIGDVKQSIYIFRGATGDAFFNQSDFTNYELGVNYRSYQEIIDFADAVNENYYNQNHHSTILTSNVIEEVVPHSKVTCVKGEGGNVIGVFGEDDAMDLISGDTKINCGELLSKMIADKRTQILCRANRQVKKLQSHNIANVSTIHQAKGLEYDNVILVDFTLTSQEENNVAYVAMTRARNNLIIVDYDTLLYYICALGIEQSNKLF